MLNDLVTSRREQASLVGDDEILAASQLVEVVDEQDPHYRELPSDGPVHVLPQ